MLNYHVVVVVVVWGVIVAVQQTVGLFAQSSGIPVRWWCRFSRRCIVLHLQEVCREKVVLGFSSIVGFSVVKTRGG